MPISAIEAQTAPPTLLSGRRGLRFDGTDWHAELVLPLDGRWYALDYGCVD